MQKPRNPRAHRSNRRPGNTTRLTFLGTGTSHGIPMIGCSCDVCRSGDPRDKRTRSSLLVELPEGTVLIDTGPELRLQCIANDVDRVDAILFTHTHADHIAGLDDMRRFSHAQRQAIPCYGSPATISALTKMFDYAFRELDQGYSERPKLRAVVVNGPFPLFGKTVIPLKLLHGADEVLGFRIDRWAYCTDCSEIPPQTARHLHDLDVLILDALRYTPHFTHFNVEQALGFIAEVKPKRTFFTHIAHEIKHADLEAKLPEGVYLGYDGLRINVDA